jgi:hypothetical protein
MNSKDYVWAWVAFTFLAVSFSYGLWSTYRVCQSSESGLIVVSGTQYKCPFKSS